MALARMTRIVRGTFVEMEGSQLSLPCKIERRDFDDQDGDTVYIYVHGSDELHVFYATSIGDVLDIHHPGSPNDWWLAIQAGV